MRSERPDRRPGAGLRPGLLWGGGAVVLALVAGVVPLLFNPDYYWNGDTQVAYFGALYHLGEELREGRIPLLNPAAWHGGAYAVDASWGRLNPLTWLHALAATGADDAAAYMAAVKIPLLGLSAAGTFVLARSYRVGQPLAFVVAVLVPLSGFTMYVDEPAWFRGTIVSGLLPWAWWGIRRTAIHGRNPAPALVAAYLLATTGYVFGTLMLAVVTAATLVDGYLARRWVGLRRALLVGVCSGLFALATHAPFALSASVTAKNVSRVLTADRGSVRIDALLSGSVPLEGSQHPVFYVAWLLPMLVFVDWRRAAHRPRDLAGLGVVAVVTVLWLLGPTVIGPLRWPQRVMPYAVLVALLLAAVAFSRGRTVLSGGRLAAALGITFLSGYVVAASEPSRWRVQLVATLVVAVGLAVTWLLLGGGSRLGPRLGPRPVAAALVAGLWTVGIVAVQHHYMPNGGGSPRGMPSQLSAYSDRFPAATGNTFVVGRYRELLLSGQPERPFVPMGNMWYATGLETQNHASSTQHADYVRRYCMNFMGNACRQAVNALFEREPTTGRTHADLMATNSVVLVKRQWPLADDMPPPAGWRRADESKLAVTWVREQPAPQVGGVTWQEEGLAVRQLSQTPEQVRLAVDEVPPGGGRLALSRLDWPGYHASGAEIAPSVADYLLSLRVPESSEGQVVTLTYAPPHWGLLRGGLVAGLLVGLAWSVAELGVVGRLRRGRLQRAR